MRAEEVPEGILVVVDGAGHRVGSVAVLIHAVIRRFGRPQEGGRRRRVGRIIIAISLADHLAVEVLVELTLQPAARQLQVTVVVQPIAHFGVAGETECGIERRVVTVALALREPIGVIIDLDQRGTAVAVAVETVTPFGGSRVDRRNAVVAVIIPVARSPIRPADRDGISVDVERRVVIDAAGAVVVDGVTLLDRTGVDPRVGVIAVCAGSVRADAPEVQHGEIPVAVAVEVLVDAAIAVIVHAVALLRCSRKHGDVRVVAVIVRRSEDSIASEQRDAIAVVVHASGSVIRDAAAALVDPISTDLRRAEVRKRVCIVAVTLVLGLAVGIVVGAGEEVVYPSIAVVVDSVPAHLCVAGEGERLRVVAVDRSGTLEGAVPVEIAIHGLDGDVHIVQKAVAAERGGVEDLNDPSSSGRFAVEGRERVERLVWSGEGFHCARERGAGLIIKDGIDHVSDTAAGGGEEVLDLHRRPTRGGEINNQVLTRTDVC